MRKKTLWTVTLFAGLLFVSASLMADPFSVVQNFSGTKVKGVNAKQVSDKSPFQITINVGNVPLGASLTDATYSLTHYGNAGLLGELWLAGTAGSRLLGALSTSSNGWVTNTWTLSSAVLSEITQGNAWSLTVRLSEWTLGNDTIYLDQASLKGHFKKDKKGKGGGGGTTAVPEPASLVLLGLGLVVSAIFARKKILGVHNPPLRVHSR